jgi:hypothetical protein
VNNRFAAAAKMNRLMTDEARPFWGRPARQVQRTLSATKPVGGYGDVPEFRATEQHVRTTRAGQAKSQWQLSGAGAVGRPDAGGRAHGQAADGRARAQGDGVALPDRLARAGPRDAGRLDVLAAEIYPTLFPGPPSPARSRTRPWCA